MSEKKYKKEWSFSFGELGDRISSAFGASDEDVTTSHFSESLEGVQSATIKLELSVGEAHVSPLTGSDNLIEADITHVGEIEFSKTGGAEPKIKLEQKSGKGGQVVGSLREMVGGLGRRSDLKWDVRLSPDVPLNLDIEGGVGPSHLNLTELDVTALNVEGGVGGTNLMLPARDKGYEAKVEGGVGGLTVTLPEDGALKLKLEGGVGGVNLRVPEGAAVRLVASGGLGGINVAGAFNKISEKDEFMSKIGVWETDGYGIATHQIEVHYEGGVGGLNVRMV